MSNPTRVFVRSNDGLDLFEQIEGVYKRVAYFDDPVNPTGDMTTDYGLDVPIVDVSFVTGEIADAPAQESDDE